MIYTENDVHFVPNRVARGPKIRDGIQPSTASIIVSEFVSCPECYHDIETNVIDAVYEDRDVLWDDDLFRSSSHTCEKCGTDLRIFVEEKAYGVIGESQLPDYAETSTEVHFIECGVESYIVVNTNQIFIHEQ